MKVNYDDIDDAIKEEESCDLEDVSVSQTSDSKRSQD